MWPSYSSIPKASVMFIMSFLLCHVTSTYSKFKVAVYEHTVDLPNLKIKIDRESALITMMKNLDVYKEQTIAAKGRSFQLGIIRKVWSVTAAGRRTELSFKPDKLRQTKPTRKQT